MAAIQALSQNDPSWKYKRLGLNNPNTIGKWGCLLTCMAMVGNRFAKNYKIFLDTQRQQ